MLRVTAAAPEMSTPAMSSIPFGLAKAFCMSTTTTADLATSISTGSGFASSVNMPYRSYNYVRRGERSTAIRQVPNCPGARPPLFRGDKGPPGDFPRLSEEQPLADPVADLFLILLGAF